jgi:hypothetical protein
MRSRWCAASIALVHATTIATMIAPARADDADKATARELAKSGIAAANEGDCASAIERLERAEALYHAPTHLQYLARCYEKVGRLVAAVEAWRKIEAEDAAANASPAFVAARAEAEKLRPALEARLSHLRISTDRRYDDLELRIDGGSVASSVLDVDRVIDPGLHRVRATTRSGLVAELEVTLAEHETRAITLTLVGKPSEPAAVGGAAPAAPSASVRGDAAGAEHHDREPQTRTIWPAIGWGALGVGAATFATGVGFGVASKAAYDDVASACTPHAPCSKASTASNGAQLQTTANTLMIAGAAVGLVGVGLVLFAPSGHRTVALEIGGGPNAARCALAGSF